MKEIKAFQCGFCAKCWPKAQSTANHERSCRNNPARKHCITCKHSCEKSVPCGYPSPEDYYQEAERWVPWCSVHKRFIHEKPYFIDCDEFQVCSSDEAYYHDLDPEEVFNCLPGTCHHYEYKGYAGWRKPFILKPAQSQETS